jgi:CRP/FNR family cyclic AMP-dependent transcriptional regulator
MDNFLEFSKKGRLPVQHYRPLLERGLWFTNLPEDFKQALLTHAEIRHCAANQYLFTRDEVFNGIFCLLDGDLHINNQNSDGKQILLAVLEPNSWFGEAALSDGQLRPCSAMTDTGCTVLWLAPALLKRIMDEVPSRWRYIAALLAEKMRWAHNKIEETTLMPALQRVAHRLIVMAERCNKLGKTGQCLLHIPQEHLASMLALSRQTTNQILKQLEAKHIIRICYREIEIINIDALKQMSKQLF